MSSGAQGVERKRWKDVQSGFTQKAVATTEMAKEIASRI